MANRLQSDSDGSTYRRLVSTIYLDTHWTNFKEQMKLKSRTLLYGMYKYALIIEYRCIGKLGCLTKKEKNEGKKKKDQKRLLPEAK